MIQAIRRRCFGAEYSGLIGLRPVQISSTGVLIEEIKPNVILTEGILGIGSIAFTLIGHYLKIPVVSIFTYFSYPGSEKKLSPLLTKFRLTVTDKIPGDATNFEPRKFSMLRYTFRRYQFLLRTLKAMDYNFF